MLIKRFSANTAGRDLIVGDVHGHFTKLRSALDAVGFDPARDRVFSVGDLVDRGPESEHVIDWLAYPWFHAVRGNHEDMVMRYAAGEMATDLYACNGGAWMIGKLRYERIEYGRAVAGLPIAIELETALGTVGLVHAECPLADWALFAAVLRQPGRLPPAELDHLIAMAQWKRDRFNSLDDSHVQNVRAVVVGHTPMERHTSLGNTYYIDTGAWLPEDRFPGRRFTVLDACTLMPAFKPLEG